jgi:hypothetical protein
MRKLPRLDAIVLAAAMLCPVPALAQEERLVAPELPGFVVGFEKANINQSIREEVPRGETVQRWSKMVTTQWFRKLAERLTPTEYAGKMLESLPRACPGATASAVQKVTGQDAVRLRVVCPSTATGQAESFFLLAVAGKEDMHVKQVAFRGEASAADFLWARKFLDGVYLCRKKSKNPACR